MVNTILGRKRNVNKPKPRTDRFAHVNGVEESGDNEQSRLISVFGFLFQQGILKRTLPWAVIRANYSFVLENRNNKRTKGKSN